MPSITEPAATRAIAVSPRQPLRLVADSATDWWKRNQTTGEAWTQINPGGTDVAELVWETPSSVTNRLTFDRIQIQVNTGSAPSDGDTGGLHLNLCEGPAAVLWASAAVRNEAREEPSLRPWEGEDDDPPLGLPLAMPAANRDRLGSVLCETVSEPGGPSNLISSLGPGVFVDSAGKLGVRTPFTNDVRGLGPFPAVAAWYHGGLYFQHDFGKSRNLALTRVLYQDGSSHVAVVRGDGRRNTYRWNGAAFDAAAGVRNSLTSSGGVFEETTPSGRLYRYDSNGRLQRVVDRIGNPAYFSYDANNRLMKIEPATGSGRLGLVPYLSYDGSGLLTRLVLEDPNAASNNRVSYFDYDANRNLQKIIGPESCVTYFEYNDPLQLSAVTDSEGFRWYFAFDANYRVTRVVDALGRAAYFSFDTSSPLATVKDRAAKATYYRYNAFGSPDRVFNVETPADYHSWDGEGNLTRSKNRLGNEWVYEYDARQNRISSTDPLGAKWYFAYDSQDLLRKQIDPIDRTVYLDFDGSRNRTKWIDPLGNAVYYEYESSGLLRQRKDRRGAFTYFVWDGKANLEKANDALGQTAYFAYNSANERTAQVDPLGRISYMEYDKRGRLTKAVNPIGAASYMAYDGRCNLVIQKDALLRQVDHSYDGNSNRSLTLLPSVDGVRNPAYWFYDEEERVSTVVNARLFPTYMEYDALGRLQRQKDAFFVAAGYLAYDDAHQLQFRVDGRGNPVYFQFDAAGRGTHVKNALLEETYFGFNAAHERVLVKDALSRHIYFQYDPRGWQRQVKSAIGAISYLVFDEEGNRERAVDPLGKASYFSFDLLGRLTHSKDQLLGTTYMGYDRASQVVLRLDELGAATYLSYDPAGRAQQTLAPPGLLTYMAYDLVGNMLHQNLDQGYGNQPWGSSPYGGERATTYMAYDALNRRTASVDPFNRSSYLFYDRNNNVERARNARNFTTYFTYDALDRRTHVKDPVHLASTYLGFDAVGNVIRSIDQQGQTAYMTYDRLNRVSFQHDLASGLLSYMSFDAVGNRTEAHALLGVGGERRSSYFQFDDVNRVIKAIAPDTGATYFEFDLANNQVRVVDPMGRPAYMAYDELNRLKARHNAFSEVSYLVYDARSSVTRQIDAEGRTAYLAYDPARRLWHQSNALGEFSYFLHDARGQRTHVLNPRGYSTYFRFDLFGRPSHRIHALGGVAYMGYDEVGNRVLNVDELGNPTYFTFDGLNRRTHVKDALLAVSYMGFDNRSSQVIRVDADGRCTYMGYDAARRLEKQWFANPVAGESSDVPAYFAYNEASELARVDDRLKGFGVSYYDRDVMGRLVKKGTAAGGVYYAFDASGKRTSLKDPGLAENVYVWDAAGRLEKEQLSAGRAVYFAYDRAGLLAKRLLPGGESGLPHRVMAYLFYDEAGRTRRIENRGSAWDTVINYFHYERNQNGFPTWIRREEDKNTYYQWDALDRLIVEQQLAGSTVSLSDYYSYDQFGNRTAKLNTLTGVTTEAFLDARNLNVKERNSSTGTAIYFEFDSAHRLMRRLITDGSASHYFSYDQRDQIKNVQLLPTVGSLDTFELGFNAAGEKVFKKDTAASSPAYLAWDGMSVLMHRTAAGTVTHRFRHAPDPGRQLAAFVEFDPVAFGTPKQLMAGDRSTRKLMQNEGAAYSYYNYDAFGQTKTLVTGSGLTQNFHLRFTPDEEYEGVTLGDLYLCKARFAASAVSMIAQGACDSVRAVLRGLAMRGCGPGQAPPVPGMPDRTPPEPPPIPLPPDLPEVPNIDDLFPTPEPRPVPEDTEIPVPPCPIEYQVVICPCKIEVHCHEVQDLSVRIFGKLKMGLRTFWHCSLKVFPAAYAPSYEYCPWWTIELDDHVDTLKGIDNATTARRNAAVPGSSGNLETTLLSIPITEPNVYSIYVQPYGQIAGEHDVPDNPLGEIGHWRRQWTSWDATLDCEIADCLIRTARTPGAIPIFPYGSEHELSGALPGGAPGLWTSNSVISWLMLDCGINVHGFGSHPGAVGWETGHRGTSMWPPMMEEGE